MIEGFTDPIITNRLVEAVNNYSTSIRQLALRESGYDPRRNIAEECGFPDPVSFSSEKFKHLFDTDAIAARVVELLSRECWQTQFEIYESEDSEVATPFESFVNNLSNSLRSEQGYHKPKPTEGDLVKEYLARADVECGKGRYGIVLVGIDDGLDLKEPAPFTPSDNPTRKLIYLRVFPEVYAQISVRENDRKNPRYGQPLIYNVTFDSVDEGSLMGSGPMRNGQVHWSRIVHIVDNPTSGEVLGVPRLSPVLYDVLTAQKPRYGSGEIYWKNAQQKLSFETHPQLGGDVLIDTAGMKRQIEQVMNGLQQWWALKGMHVNAISPTSIDPQPYIDACISTICIKLGVPIRIFKGSERGELASNQDDDAWNDRLKERQNRFITPRIIVPFYNRLINLGVLPIPTNGYTVDWPDLTSQSEKDKADIGATKVTALSNAISSGLTAVIPVEDILTKFAGMDEKEAQMIIEKQQKLAQELGGGSDSPLTQTVGGVQGMIDLLAAQSAGTLQSEQLKQMLMIFYKLDETKASALVSAGIKQPVVTTPVDTTIPTVPPKVVPTDKPPFVQDNPPVTQPV